MSRDMFDDPRSHEADDLALQAELLERRGEHAGARELYRRAAALEEALAHETPVSSPRLRATRSWGPGISQIFVGAMRAATSCSDGSSSIRLPRGCSRARTGRGWMTSHDAPRGE